MTITKAPKAIILHLPSLSPAISANKAPARQPSSYCKYRVNTDLFCYFVLTIEVYVA